MVSLFCPSSGGCCCSALADILEPVGSAVLLVEPGLTVGEAALDAALALVGVGAVEEGDVLVADIAEPVGGESECQRGDGDEKQEGGY